MTRPNHPQRRGRSSSSGFTLIELLVVLLIIAILSALLVPAISSGLRAGKRATVTADISALATALENFKTKYGDYPPSRIYLSEAGYFPITDTTNSVARTMAPGNTALYDIKFGQLVQRSVSAMRKLFPRVNINTNGNVFDPTTSTVWYDFNGNGIFDTNAYILQGHECLVFFLGGIPLKSDQGYAMTGFGKDPTNPFTNSIVGNNMYGSNRNPPMYDFAPGRLVLDTANPTSPFIPGYYDSLGDVLSVPGGTYNATTKRIVYENGKINFFAYFSVTGLGGVYDPNDVNFLATENDGYLTVYGRNTIGSTSNSVNVSGLNPVSPAPNPYSSSTTFPTTGTIIYHKPQTFQIISAGLDGLYGIGGQYSPPPAPVALPVDLTHASLITNANPNTEEATSATVRVRERDNITNFAAASQLD